MLFESPSRQKTEESDQGKPLWAFDVSTSWHHRGHSPVGITRTEVEFARYFCKRHPNIVLTVYDRKSKQHFVLPTEYGEQLLGLDLSPPDESEAAANEANTTSDAIPSLTRVRKAGHLRRWCYWADLTGSLLALLILPSKWPAYHKLKSRTLRRLAKRGWLLSDRWREATEKKLRVHPSRPKYRREYQTYQNLYSSRLDLAPCRISHAKKLDFSKLARYISVGCSWDMNNLEAISRERCAHGFSVTTCVYDLVPIVMPDVVAHGLNELFPPHVLNQLSCSDSIACISESTKHDLEQYIQRTGSPRPRIEVCRLGYAPDVPSVDDCPASLKHLSGKPFALYVATFEPRKNHVFLHFLWNQLIDRGIAPPIPVVMAGCPGWRTEDLLDRMRLNRKLTPEHLVLAHGLSDAEIAWLYRNCRFTVYPSLYEGWGLPITESLSHGKYCIASDNSSLPEAGQGLTRNINLLDGREWIEEVERCITDDNYLHQREERISRGFETRSWEDSAAELYALVEHTPSPTRTSNSPVVGKAA